MRPPSEAVTNLPADAVAGAPLEGAAANARPPSEVGGISNARRGWGVSTRPRGAARQ